MKMFWLCSISTYWLKILVSTIIQLVRGEGTGWVSFSLGLKEVLQMTEHLVNFFT